jgi:hypothetical protein
MKEQMMTEKVMQNGWQLISKKRASTGAYDKWDKRVVVIVPREKKQVHICLTKAAWEALGKPEEVEFFNRGTNIGMLNTSTVVNAADGYAVSNKRGLKPSKLYYISCRGWLSERRLEQGVYDAHMEDDLLVFDTAQKPGGL